MPVPAPATMQLLAGFPVHSVDIKGELVTPTGAALVTTLADPTKAGQIPAMRVLSSGFGAGKKQFVPDMPNLLRVVLGETTGEAESTDATPQTVAVLETNLDDHSPELFDLLMERCFDAGALDVFFAPIQMKKKPACDPGDGALPAGEGRAAGRAFVSGNGNIRYPNAGTAAMDACNAPGARRRPSLATFGSKSVPGRVRKSRRPRSTKTASAPL